MKRQGQKRCDRVCVWAQAGVLLVVSACAPSAGEGSASEGAPTPGGLDSEDFAGGQSGDEGTELATPCLASERLAFAGHLQELESGIARVSVSKALTPAAMAEYKNFEADGLEGCVSGYFTTQLPSPGAEVLVLVFSEHGSGQESSQQPNDESRDETMDESPSSLSIAVVERKGELVTFFDKDLVTTMTVDALLDPNCKSDWQEKMAARTGAADDEAAGASPATCGMVE